MLILFFFARELSAIQQQLQDAEGKVLTLEAELKVFRESRPTPVALRRDLSVRHLPGVLDKENKPTLLGTSLSRIASPISLPDSPEISSEPIPSSEDVEYNKLAKRHNAARLIIEDLTNKNVVLNKDLAVCRTEIESLQTKVHHVNEDKKTKLACLEERDTEIQSLHDRIEELLNDRDGCIGQCDTITAENNQLREFNDRLKREHAFQLETLDKMLQDRERTI